MLFDFFQIINIRKNIIVKQNNYVNYGSLTFYL